MPFCVNLKHAAKHAGLKYPVCPHDFRSFWITAMFDKHVEIAAIAHLAGASVRMLIKNDDEPHASEAKRLLRCCRSSEPHWRPPCGWSRPLKWRE
jgi:Phage integrase family.